MRKKLNLKLPSDAYLHLLDIYKEIEPFIIIVDGDVIKYLDEDQEVILEESWNTELLILVIDSIKESYKELPTSIKYNGEIIYNGYFEYVIREVAFAIDYFNKSTEEGITKDAIEFLEACINHIAPELVDKIIIRNSSDKLLVSARDKVAGFVMQAALKWNEAHQVTN